MIIYFVRHAEPVADKSLTDNERIQIGLSDLGKLQARAVGKKIRKLSANKLYSSPFVRAKETAEIIGKETSLRIEFDDRLREFITDFGTRDQLLQKSLKQKARSNPELQMPGGESLNDGIGRLENFIEEVSHKSLDKICVVTHRIILEGFLAKKFNIKPYDYEWLRPASITAISLNDVGKLKVLFYDRKFRDLPLVIETLKRRFRFH